MTREDDDAPMNPAKGILIGTACGLGMLLAISLAVWLLS